MKKLIALVATLLVMFCAISTANAQDNSYPRDIQLSWNWPTHYEIVVGDTEAAEILDGDLTDARLTCTRHNGEIAFNTVIPIVVGTLPGQRQTQVFSGDIPKPGSYTCLAYARVGAVESDPSNAVVKRYTGRPQPNTALAAQ